MAKVDRIEDLPSWFRLDKYVLAEQFRASDWLRHITARRNMLDTILFLKEGGSVVSASLTHERWQEIRDEPLKHLGSDNSWSSIEGQLFYLRDDQPVRSLGFSELRRQVDDDNDGVKAGLRPADYVERWRELAPDFYENANSGPVDPMGTPLVDDHIFELTTYRSPQWRVPILRINLGAPDAVLKESFALWLKRAREKHPPIFPKSHKPAYDRWTRYGLLPYLDLAIWAIETESHIPDRVMAAAIMPRRDAGESNLRKTIKPLAAELMYDLSELRAIAAHEAERDGS